MTIHDDARTAGDNAFRKVYDDALQRLANERDTLQAQLDNHVCPTPEPEPEPEPEPTSKRWYIGMATDAAEWDQRVAEVGRPVNVRRRFKPTWDPAGLVALAKEGHASGCLPYISTKLGAKGESSISAWTKAANGNLDADAERLGRDLSALGYPVRVTFHHEPRPASIAELVVWGQALTRIFTRMRAGAGNKASNLILGPTDNGFPWSDGWTGNVTKQDLDRYYTDQFLAACDVMGADFYDGATNSNPGEPAWVKMKNFATYFNARGFRGVNDPGWKYDSGEFQLVDPEDGDQLWDFLDSDAGADFNALCIFNSPNNNRNDIPDRIGGTWVLSGERLAAFRRILDNAKVTPTT